MGMGKISDRRFMATMSRLLLSFVMVTVMPVAGAGILFAAAPVPGVPVPGVPVPGATGAAAAPAAPAIAPDDWANTPLGKDFRGPGFYLSWLKIIAAWLLFLLWVYTTDWVSTDCDELKLDSTRWNSIVFGSFMLGYLFCGSFLCSGSASPCCWWPTWRPLSPTW